MKTFFFFGDSITLGVNDAPAGGWVGRFAGLAAQAGLPVPSSFLQKKASKTPEPSFPKPNGKLPSS